MKPAGLLRPGLSRREFLASIPALIVPFILPSCGNGSGHTGDPAGYVYEPVSTITEPELVTVRDNEAIFTWVTDSLSNSFIHLGTEGPDTAFDLSGPPTRNHYARIKGLSPNTGYVYQIRSGDKLAPATDRSPGNFRTLSEPPGEFLFDFATVNDTHVGEQVAGLICIGGMCLGQGFTTPWPDHPHWEFTNEAAVDAINEISPEFVIHKGDVSSEYSEDQFRTAKAIFDGLRMPYYVLRGNHDRIGEREEDFFKKVFNLESTYRFFEHKEHVFVLLDSVNLFTGLPEIDDQQFSWLEEVLASFTNTRVLIFLHHTVTRGAQFFGITPGDRERLVSLIARHGNVIGVFSGHSHRACVTYDLSTGDLPFAETPSTKEYPGGFAYYRIYSEGYIQTFYRTSCSYCLPWFEITKGEYLGLAPRILFGQVQDRSFTHVYPGLR